MEQTLIVDDPEVDPGWRFSLRMFRFLIPGYLQYTMRQGERRDGLDLMRQVWISFTSALVLFGVVVFFIATAPVGHPTMWLIGLAVATVGLHGAQTWALSKPLDCTDRTALATSYRSRFFLAIAFSEAIALLAFVAAMILGRWWIYWLFLPFALAGHLRVAPTPVHLEADQEVIRIGGCPLSLVGALRAPRPE